MKRRREPGREVWVDDRVEIRPSEIEGRGLFVQADVPEGTVLIRLGGRLVSSAELQALMAAANAGAYVDTITVYDDEHLVLPSGTIAHFGNHSCDPNLWLVGPYELASRGDLDAGQELTVDYATISGGAGFVMVCDCGTELCRGSLTSEDWRRRDLQERYQGHWAPALQQRIDSES